MESVSYAHFWGLQLPLPFVKAGYLTIPPVGDTLAPHSEWQRLWFVLNHEALYEVCSAASNATRFVARVVQLYDQNWASELKSCDI